MADGGSPSHIKETDATDAALAEDLKKLGAYRDSVVQTILSDEKEYHTTVTYIAAGALALFLTINEKFFHLLTSKSFWLFEASVAFLFITLLLYVINIINDIGAHEKLRDSADEMLANKKYEKPILLIIWQRLIRKSRNLTYWRFATLLIGILLELAFILINMRATAPVKEDARIEISIPVSDSSSVLIDSSKTNTKIKINHR